MERYDKMSAEDVAEILNMWDSEEDKINKEVEKKVAERLVEEKGKVIAYTLSKMQTSINF